MQDPEVSSIVVTEHPVATNTSVGTTFVRDRSDLTVTHKGVHRASRAMASEDKHRRRRHHWAVHLPMVPIKVMELGEISLRSRTALGISRMDSILMVIDLFGLRV